MMNVELHYQEASKAFTIYSLFIACITITSTSSAAAPGRSQRQTPNVWADEVFDHLDVGLYWARANDQFEKASSTSANGSIYFNVHRPTMIYIHGLQPGTVRVKEREDFSRVLVFGEKHLDFARMWRRRGYNVGILYWNQYADQAEKTIWSIDDMQWRDRRETLHNQQRNKTVTQILMNSYMSAMKHYVGKHDTDDNVRFVGHSLGNQLAIRLAHLLHHQPHLTNRRMIPMRVSLLDPYYSAVNEAAGRCARMVEDMAERGVAIDTHMTTFLGHVGHLNQALITHTAYVRHYCDYYGEFDFGQYEAQKHSAAIWMYFWSLKNGLLDPRPVRHSTWPVVNAHSSHRQVRQWMRHHEYVVQVGGENTYWPSDDVYRLVDRRVPDNA